jgi:pyridoxine 5-phosphate synthase
LDVEGHRDSARGACAALPDVAIRVSLFIDPEPRQLDAAVAVGAPVVELHTGAYADARGDARGRELRRIVDAVAYAQSIGLIVHAGHGLNYDNVDDVAAITGIRELNIGHSIIARSVFDGLEVAVREMKRLMTAARTGR